MPEYPCSAKVICPFYLREAQKSVTCEGIIPGTLQLTRFGSEDEKLAYQAAYCESFEYACRCRLAAALMEKYEK